VLIKALLDVGADIYARGDWHVRSSTDYLLRYDSEEIVFSFSALDYAILGKNMSAIRALIDAGFDINAEREDYLWEKTALEFALVQDQIHLGGGSSYVDVIILLLELGAKDELLSEVDKKSLVELKRHKELVTSNLDLIMKAALQGGNDGMTEFYHLLPNDYSLRFIGYSAALVLKLILPENEIFSGTIALIFDLNSGKAKKEILKLKALQNELVEKFRAKNDKKIQEAIQNGEDYELVARECQDPEEDAKIAILAFVSHPAKSLFLDLMILTKSLNANCIPERAVMEIVGHLVETKIPGFTQRHCNAVIEVLMERIGARGLPSTSPVTVKRAVKLQNLVEEKKEEGTDEEKSYSPPNLSPVLP
jgi:hypothetical protein